MMLKHFTHILFFFQCLLAFPSEQKMYAQSTENAIITVKAS